MSKSKNYVISAEITYKIVRMISVEAESEEEAKKMVEVAIFEGDLDEYAAYTGEQNFVMVPLSLVLEVA